MREGGAVGEFGDEAGVVGLPALDGDAMDVEDAGGGGDGLAGVEEVEGSVLDGRELKQRMVDATCSRGSRRGVVIVTIDRSEV